MLNHGPASLTLLATLTLAISSQPSFGQLLNSLGKSPAPAAAPAEVDPLRRTTPRDSIYEMLRTCHDGRYDIAAQYLDLSRVRRDLRATQGPELAKSLCDVLDRDTRFEVGRLSNEPGGDLRDNLPPNTDGLDSLDVHGKLVEITMTKTAVGNLQAWLVSSDSVLQIPKLVELASESPIEKKLPPSLVNIRFVGTPLYIWLALILSALILSALSRLLSRLFLKAIKPAAKRFSHVIHEHRLGSFIEPLRLILCVLVFSAVIQAIGPSAILRDYLFKLLILLFIIGIASIVMRLVDVVSDTAISRLDPHERSLSYSVIPLFVRITKIVILAIGLLSVLSAWGYNTNTILAGLGVGGLAVALAAQKTIENLFGGVSVITDRPVLVGDYCKFGDQAGTVEAIGLRSTKIRTLDRTVVTIPNSVFSTMTLENFARRDRMWFHPAIPLRRTCTPDQLRSMMDAITKILDEHPMVDPTSVPLRFTKIAKESFDLEIFAYVLTPSGDEFLKVQTDLLLKIIEAGDKLGVDFAMPLQESVIASVPSKTPASEQAAPGAPEKSA